MISAAYISHKKVGLSTESLTEIGDLLKTVFDLEFVNWLMAENLELPLKHDKKNAGKTLQFVLISEPGAPLFDQEVSMELALESFEYLQSVIGGEQ